MEPVSPSHAIEMLSILQCSAMLLQELEDALPLVTAAHEEINQPSLTGICNILQHLPPDHHPAATTDTVYQYYMLDRLSHTQLLNPPDAKKKRKRMEQQLARDAILLSIFEKDPGVFLYFKKQYPSLAGLLKKKAFLRGILGHAVVKGRFIMIPIAILHQRLTATDQFVCNNHDLEYRQASKIGNHWADKCVGRLEKLKEIASSFPIHLNRIAQEKFLDVHQLTNLSPVMSWIPTKCKSLHPCLG
jgi:hypothetical protein